MLGVEIDLLSFEEALRRIEAFFLDPAPRQVMTANPLMIIASEKDPALRLAFRQADLVVPDSIGILWAGWLQGRRAEKISGIDLLERLCALAAREGRRVYLLGAAPGVALAAAEALAGRHPGLIIAGAADGYFPPESEPAVVAAVARTRPDILFVALDTPRQDGWIRRRLPHLGARVALGVGGSFDVLAGRLRRAPRWMRAVGLEWFFRLCQEPGRWRRMRGLPRFAFRAVIERF